MADGDVSVLIVDDNPGDARLVEWALSHEPGPTFRYQRAGRISVALEHLAEHRVDAVLLDLGLPDSEGTDGLRRIHETAPGVAVVVLTGSENPLLIRAAIAADAQDYLVKGIFPRGYLARVLRLAIRHKEIETQLREHRRPEPSALSELSEAGEGVVIVEGGTPTTVSAAVTELTGYAGGTLDSIPAWLQGIVRDSLGTHARTLLERDGAPTASLGAGELVLERPDGRRVQLEYVVRRPPDEKDPRLAIFVREISRQRRDPGHAAPAEGTEGRAPSPPATGEKGPTGSWDPRIVGAILDEATWVQLRELAGTDTTFLPALSSAFLEEGRGLVRRLEESARAGDTTALALTAHSLKSTAAQVGALGLSRRCAELERQGEAGNLAVARALVLRISEEFPKVAAALELVSPKG